MARIDQRLAFLVSLTVHVAIVMSVLSYAIRQPAPRPVELAPPVDADEAAARRIFLPPPAELRKLIPVSPPPQPATPPPALPPPTTLATPPPGPETRDRISIGDASSGRTDKPIILRPDQDLAAAPGRRPARDSTAPSPGAAADKDGNKEPLPKGNVKQDGVAALPTPSPKPPPMMAKGREGGPGLELPIGNGPTAAGQDRPRPRAAVSPSPVPSPPSLASSLRELEQRLAAGKVGPETATAGRQMGDLFFDPERADFTSWINHFSDEVYRNWIVPQAALFGLRGHVDISFTLDKSGAIRRLTVLKSSGTLALDRAAVNALRGSRFLPLPADYGPPEVTMEVTFFYGEGPRG